VEREATLRQSLLVLGHLAIRVHQHELVANQFVREGRLVTGNALVREGLEDLLEGRLRDTIFLDAKRALLHL